MCLIWKIIILHSFCSHCMQVQLPVKAVATSAPFLALLWAHFANMWGIYFIATNGPKYTLEVLGFNMKSVYIL